MKLFILTAIFTIFSTCIYSKEMLKKHPKFNSKTVKKSNFLRSNFSASIGGSSWNYKEVTGASKKRFMEDSGTLFGPKLSLKKYFIEDVVFLGLEYEYLTGRTTYEGGRNNSKEPLTFETNNNIQNIAAKIGLTHLLPYNFVLEYALGHTFRTLKNPASKTEGDYSRKIKYQIIPIELRVKKIFAKNHQSGIGFKYNYFLKGTATSIFDESNEYANIINEQKSGYGFQLDLTHSFASGKQIYSLTPYYRYWHIQNSRPESKIFFNPDDGQYYRATFTEPENTTEMYGVNLTVSRIF